MNIHLRYGTDYQQLNIPSKNLIGILKQKEIGYESVGIKLVEQAIESPIGTECMDNLFAEGEKIVIITSDITRPFRSDQVLPPILRKLESIGCKDDDIVIVFALGSHREHTEQEMKSLVSDEVFNRYVCVDSDRNDVIRLGCTSYGTPVDITRVIAHADKRICLGNIEYHYFAGYSGGAKAIMPGVSTKAAIQANHSMMVNSKALAGLLEGNPVRQDIEEAIRYCPIDMIVNVIQNENKQIVYAVAGHYIEAHREGCRKLDELNKQEISQLADIVIVSQGGYPKDINLYQTQKALENAKQAVRKDGIIILVGSCEEGFGNDTFRQWLFDAKNSSDIVARLESEFKLGGHKAAAIAMILEHNMVFLVSNLEPEIVSRVFLEPFATVQGALSEAFKRLGEQASVIVIPEGGSILPVLSDNK